MSSKRHSCYIIPFYHPPVLFLLLILFFVTKAANVTVDDADSAWTYSTAGHGAREWGAISPTQSCSFCKSMPDPNRVYNHTWHDTDIGNSASLTFAGTSLTIYTICPGPLPGGEMYATNYTFTMDGVGDSSVHGHGCAALTYDYAIYTKKGLNRTSHVFTITNAPPLPPDQRSNLLLDYAIYDDAGLTTTTTSTSISTSTTSTTTSTSTNKAKQTHIPGILPVVIIVAGVSLLE